MTSPSRSLHDALRAPYCAGEGCSNEECDERATELLAAFSDAGYVLVPRSAIEHVGDWHNKCCGVGQESLDEVIFGTLHAALWPKVPTENEQVQP